MQLKYRIVLIVAPVVFIADQITKWFVKTHVGYQEFISVVPGYFDIVHVTNRGAAFGMLADSHSAFRVPFFYIVSVIAVIVLCVMIYKLGANERLLAFVFALIIGGISGNIIDRIRFGAVTDFLSVHFRDKVADFAIFGHNFNFRLEWPAFNVADSAITVSMILLVWSIFVFEKGKDK